MPPAVGILTVISSKNVMLSSVVDEKNIVSGPDMGLHRLLSFPTVKDMGVNQK